jgi:hypothetical protein
MHCPTTGQYRRNEYSILAFSDRICILWQLHLNRIFSRGADRRDTYKQIGRVSKGRSRESSPLFLSAKMMESLSAGVGKSTAHSVPRPLAFNMASGYSVCNQNCIPALHILLAGMQHFTSWRQCKDKNYVICTSSVTDDHSGYSSTNTAQWCAQRNGLNKNCWSVHVT